MSQGANNLKYGIPCLYIIKFMPWAIGVWSTMIFLCQWPSPSIYLLPGSSSAWKYCWYSGKKANDPTTTINLLVIEFVGLMEETKKGFKMLMTVGRMINLSVWKKCVGKCLKKQRLFWLSTPHIKIYLKISVIWHSHITSCWFAKKYENVRNNDASYSCIVFF